VLPVTPAGARPFADDQSNQTGTVYIRQKPALRDRKDLKFSTGLP
jgi:hypothetical protein